MIFCMLGGANSDAQSAQKISDHIVENPEHCALTILSARRRCANALSVSSDVAGLALDVSIPYMEDISARESTTKPKPNQLTR